ncbi:unnamed protein product [Boreogadus saida]
MPRLLPGTLLLEGVSGVVEEVPGVEEHEGENMEDLDIIRHDILPGRMQPGLQPGQRPGCRARDRAAEPVIGLQPGREPGSAARPRALQPGCSPAENRGLQHGRRPGCRARGRAAARPRTGVRRPAKVARGLSRSSESPRPGSEARGRAAEYN